MKTPRDILFTRHQATAPKLDAIRREVMNGFNHQVAKAPSRLPVLVSWCLHGVNRLWLELIWPSRRIWAGLATVWIGILLVNFSQRDPAPMVAMKSPPAPEMMLAFRQQERLLAELLEPNEPRIIAEPPKVFVPRPRSELRLETLMT